MKSTICTKTVIFLLSINIDKSEAAHELILVFIYFDDICISMKLRCACAQSSPEMFTV